MAGMSVSVKFRAFPAQIAIVERKAGRVIMPVAATAVKEQAILNTPGLGRTPYEPTSIQTGKLRGSFSQSVAPDGMSAEVKSSTPYSRRQEFRIVKSGRRKAYLRPALQQARI